MSSKDIPDETVKKSESSEVELFRLRSTSDVSELVSLPEDVASGQKEAGRSLVSGDAFRSFARLRELMATNKLPDLGKQRRESNETF